MADTRWGGIMDVLVEEEQGNIVSSDVWGKYKVLIVPSFLQHEQQKEQLQKFLLDIITFATNGGTVIIDAALTSAANPHFTSATGCDFSDQRGGEGVDVVVRSWLRVGEGWGASPTHEILRARPCHMSPGGGARIQVLVRSVGGGLGGIEMALLVRKWHGNSGGSVMTCAVAHMQGHMGLAGPCAHGVALIGDAAAVVTVRSSSGLLLAYSSSVSSDGSSRTVVLANNAEGLWVGEVRLAAVGRGRAWSKCVQQTSISQLPQQQQKQLTFETGVDGEAAVQGVMLQPLGVVVISCTHVLED